MSTETEQHADIHERIRRGDFKNKREYPAKPSRPLLLSKAVGVLTAEEIASVQQVKTDYAAALESQRKAREAYDQEERRLEDEFRAALLAEHGMDQALPISGMLYKLAWDKGHSSGLNDVACEMADLVDVYHEAIRMRDEAAKK